MGRRVGPVLVALLVTLVVTPSARAEESPRFVKVMVDFGAESTGDVLVTEEGGVRSLGRLAASSIGRRVRRSTGIFTLVHDGGESRLAVATQVPQPQVAFYRDYAARTGRLAAGVAFSEVGTSLKIRAKILGDERIRVRVTPTISYFAGDGSGAIEFAEASTELVVTNGRPVVLGGATTRIHDIMRRVLEYREYRGTDVATVVLTATTR